MPGVEDDEDIDPTALPTFEPPTPAASAQGDNSQTTPVRKKRFVRKKVSKLSLASK
jgi:hypothetical protein